MTKKRQNNVVLVDTETDGIEYTKVHCIAAARLDGPVELFTDVTEFEEWCYLNTTPTTRWVGHNICGFDYWVINDMTNVKIRQDQVYDTSVISKLAHYQKFNTHSLSELSQYYGSYKGDYDGGWDKYTTEMGEYCKQDVEALRAIYQGQPNLTCYEAIKVEHDMAFLCRQMQQDGFLFDKAAATHLLSEVESEMRELEEEMQEAWPPELVEDRRIQWRKKKDGTLYATCAKAMADAPKYKREGEELILYRYKDFNPGSPKDRIDKLWDAGWQPFDKTKGHLTFERELRSRRRKGYM